MLQNNIILQQLRTTVFRFLENADATMDHSLDPDKSFSKKFVMFDMRYL